MQINKNNWLVFLMILSFIIFNKSGFAQQQNDFDIVTHRVVSDLQGRENAQTLHNKVQANLTAIQANGTWPDINYSDKAVAIWSPAEHLLRVLQLALAFSQADSSQPDVLYPAIVKALQAWNAADPKCPNWWYNQIYCPQLLGQIMLLMQVSKPLPTSLQDALLQKMDRGDMYKQTGANKFDVALHNMYSALLTRNATLMDRSVSQCFQPIILTNASEGIQFDHSYLQHGPQLQIGSYGSVFLVGEYQVRSFVSGTRWQMPGDKKKLLSTYLNDVFLKTVRYKYFDFSVMGRGFTRKDSGNAGAIEGLRASINRLKISEPGDKQSFAEYDAALKRAMAQVDPFSQINTDHQYFWKGDYTLHVNPGYLFSVRTNSTRTRRTETGNGENLYGRYMSDGATNIQRSGNEYFNIFPLWEYDKIPGVTCRDYQADKPAINSWDQPGTTNFTGGVSDGRYGVSTYTLDFDSVKAKKAWFFFDKQIVCQGAGISSDVREPITTTVNQCWSRGQLVTDTQKKAYWQDSIGYYFQPGTSIRYSNQEQKGTWKHINSSQSPDTVKGKVFKLWIDHGLYPKNSSYSYVVVPGVSEKYFLQDMPYKYLNVVANTDAIQAVSAPRIHVLQAVFYKPGKLQTKKTTITVNRPCVLMLEKTNSGHPILYVADPSHQLKSISISLNGRKLNCILPVNEYTGASIKLTN